MTMKVVILAGGFGSRLSEETVLKPKPMVEIGGKPILWHIMNIYSTAGFSEFIIALGYKGEYIKDYFLNFNTLNNDISVNTATGNLAVHSHKQPDWNVHLVDTGLHTQTGGRLGRLRKWLQDEQTFMFTYGDGVADIDLRNLLAFHRAHGKLATVTAVLPPARFGRIGFRSDLVAEFMEKSPDSDGWINGGYFVLERQVLDYIEDDQCVWERGPLVQLARDEQLVGYRHPGFWSCMDTIRERSYLEELWDSGNAAWKIWDD